MTGLFVSAMPGLIPPVAKVPNDPATQVDFALDRMKAVVEAAGLKLANMVFVNPFLTAQIPMRVMNDLYAQRFVSATLRHGLRSKSLVCLTKHKSNTPALRSAT